MILLPPMDLVPERVGFSEPAPLPTMPPSLCPSQAHLPGSISGSRSVKGYGDREEAGKVPRGERNQRTAVMPNLCGIATKGEKS